MGTICVKRVTITPESTVTIQRTGGASSWLKLMVRSAMTWIGERKQKRLSRLALSELTDDQLADIGVTPSEARREAARPFWN